MEKLDKTFQYEIPEELKDILAVGMQVVVPFGKGSRTLTGYVIELTDQWEYDPSRIKKILQIADKGIRLEGQLIALAAWIRRTYGSTMNQALKTVLPVRQKVQEKTRRRVMLTISPKEAVEYLEIFQKKHQTARFRLLAALIDTKEMDYRLVMEQLHLTVSTVKKLEEMGILRVETAMVFRNPVKKIESNPILHRLNDTQQAIVEDILARNDRQDKRPSLVHGVTGSGKTEVYMELIAATLDRGQEAIVLIPEIALTFQTALRFYQRFGEQVTIINSRLSQGERYDQMERARTGQVKVMIGPRSALFTPFQNLGIIVIDEEHEASYKSETAPRYHARETAIERARMCKAFVVLGSATPTVESYEKALNGEYNLYELKKRVLDKPLPVSEIIDLREELQAGNRSILSDRLRSLMEDRLQKRQQIMLFLNRRGYAGFVSCRACGHVIKCPHCDVSLALHTGKRMVCHYCGYEEPAREKCPSCGSGYIGAFRAGTQQVTEIVQREFPSARVLRMDMDTTKNKDGHEKILEAFADGQADILVGTQMIVKGHDFPEVTLVGVLAADMSLYAGDYRASERTFQLLAQAAGRAGRGREKGIAIIQTYSPAHYSIQTAAAQDYEAFFKEEIAYRRLMEYPPAAHLLALYLSCREKELLDKESNFLGKELIGLIGKEPIRIIGPADAHVSKVNDIYRKVFYLKCQDQEPLLVLKEQLEQLTKEKESLKPVTIQFDMNPISGY
ncbi:MAG: primosomal protein N' [Lachnospiraceae bacterium]|nr:primosomal protein N' [Lachnospiraceae bacterium]